MSFNFQQQTAVVQKSFWLLAIKRAKSRYFYERLFRATCLKERAGGPQGEINIMLKLSAEEPADREERMAR